MQPFIYSGMPSRVVFGSGTLDRIADEVKALGCARALVLSTPQQADVARDVMDRLSGLKVGLFTGAAMHTPVEITERAMRTVSDLGADCTVAVGGGSTTGLGKAIALRTDLPQIVIPTTYAGSEATPILGETRDGLKTTQRSLKILPEVILYDVDLTLTLPMGLSATSGINAIAHAVEGLYTQDANPMVSLMAIQPIARPGPTPFTAPGCAAWCWARSAWLCITSSATRSAGPSTCPMRRPIRWSCPTPPPTTPPPRPTRWPGWPTR
jgi:maleylacetate reductase